MFRDTLYSYTDEHLSDKKFKQFYFKVWQLDANSQSSLPIWAQADLILGHLEAESPFWTLHWFPQSRLAFKKRLNQTIQAKLQMPRPRGFPTKHGIDDDDDDDQCCSFHESVVLLLCVISAYCLNLRHSRFTCSFIPSSTSFVSLKHKNRLEKMS